MTEELTIESLAYGGAGVGRIDGKVCFVPLSAPGDKLRIRITKQKQAYSEGLIEEIHVTGKCRIQPRCPIFGQCGGCQWQHIDYPVQSAAKAEILAETLFRIARVDRAAIQNVIPSEHPFAYRSRVQIKMRCIRGQLVYGFYRHGSHWVVDLPETGCMLASEKINRAVAEIRTVFAQIPSAEHIPQIDLMSAESGKLTAVIHFLRHETKNLIAFLKAHVAEMPSVTGLFLQTGRKNTLFHVYGDEAIDYLSNDNDPSEMRVSRGGFSQVNFSQNRRMIDKVLALLEIQQSHRVLDLYCGNGNFSLPCALHAAHVTGIEEFRGSIDDAEYNAKSWKLENLRFICSDVQKGLEGLVHSGERFDLIILDPPRTGARDIMHLIGAIGASKIVYVSCDPVTLARDIASLQKQGYVCKEAYPIDMFPQTYHLESVVILIKQVVIEEK